MHTTEPSPAAYVVAVALVAILTTLAMIAP